MKIFTFLLRTNKLKRSFEANVLFTFVDEILQMNFLLFIKDTVDSVHKLV